MRGNLPLPGSTRARLLDVALKQFSTHPYQNVEVNALAAEAGVTIGALYHHFQSKQGIYRVVRNEITLRLLDRMEAAADAAPPGQQLRAAVLATYDGAFRVKAGHLLLDPDLPGTPDALIQGLSAAAKQANIMNPELTAQLLNAALKAALTAGQNNPEVRADARRALQRLIPDSEG